MNAAIASSPRIGAIRRMALDLGPWWLRLFIGFMLVLTTMIDLTYVLEPTDTRQTLMPAVFFMPGLASWTLIKYPVWRLLPVSSRQLAHAQWWRIVAAPFLLLLLGLALSLAVASPFGRVRADAGQLLTLACGQLTLIGLFTGFFLLAGPVNRRFGVAGLGLALPVMVGALAIGRTGPSEALAPWLRLGGLLTVGEAVLIYALGLTFKTAQIGRQHRAVAKSAKDPVAPGGWFGLISVLAPWMAGAAILALAAQALGLAFMVRPGHGSRSGMEFAPAILMVAPLLLTVQFRASARALAGLPIGGVGLTIILHGAALVCQLVGLGLVAGAGALFSRDLIPSLLSLPLELGLSAFLIALLLRFSNPALMGFVVAPAVVLTMLLPLFGRLLPSLVMPEVGLGCLLMILGWAWTWRQLTFGAHVWRPWMGQNLRWRGTEA